MLVDPDTLRAFASQTATTADAIDENTLKGQVTEGFAGMRGSSCAWAAELVDQFAAKLTEELTDGFNGLATAARGNADSYQVTDQDLAASIKQAFPS